LSVWEHWRRHAERTPDREAIVHWRAGDEPFRWRWAALMQAVQPMAARLQEAGIRRGEVCALIVRHDPRFYPLYLAVSAVGAYLTSFFWTLAQNTGSTLEGLALRLMMPSASAKGFEEATR